MPMTEWACREFEPAGAPEGKYFVLMTGTLVRFSRQKHNVDIPALIREMNSLGVPPCYLIGVREIYFCYLSISGDCLDGRIRLHPIPDVKELASTLVHELGHHVDFREGIYLQKDIGKEKKRAAGQLSTYAKKNISEYVAVGFETFYAGTADARDKMFMENQILFEEIRKTHEKYKPLSDVSDVAGDRIESIIMDDPAGGRTDETNDQKEEAKVDEHK